MPICIRRTSTASVSYTHLTLVTSTRANSTAVKIAQKPITAAATRMINSAGSAFISVRLQYSKKNTSSIGTSSAFSGQPVTSHAAALAAETSAVAPVASSR